MGKNKLRKFAEIKTFPNVFEPTLAEIMQQPFPLKTKWNQDYFKNSRPITLELGCGRGEYTTGLAVRNPERNYIGVDIKGARIWQGAKFALENRLTNVAFIRTRIEFITSFFGPSEVDEIWLTFPDPQEKKRRAKKRLTGSRFLNAYRTFVRPGGTIHLKTDHQGLYEYTLNLLAFNHQQPEVFTTDLYGSSLSGTAGAIQTYYEQMFLREGKKVFYLAFALKTDHEYAELPETEYVE